MGNSMEDRKDVTVPMPASLVDAIEEQLGYGDSRAGWVREAARQRLEREGLPATKVEAEEAEKTDVDADTEGNGTSGRAAGAN